MDYDSLLNVEEYTSVQTPMNDTKNQTAIVFEYSSQPYLAEYVPVSS